MPIYEYECEDCGIFKSMAPMSAYKDPCACTECGKTSPRVLNSVPFLSTLDAGVRNAHNVNERASDAPKKRSTHGPVGKNNVQPRRKSVQTASGSKSFPGARPWMISH